MHIQQVETDVMQVLWNMTKALATTGAKVSRIPIYKETMYEEQDKIPKSYILLRSQITDSATNYGDGKSVIRNADCDIILVSKGYGDDSTDIHNRNKRKIREHLRNQDIEFTETNLGYDETTKSTQHTFSVEVKYGFKQEN